MRHRRLDSTGRYCVPEYLILAFDLVQSCSDEQKIYLLSSFCQGFTVEELSSREKKGDTSRWDLLNQVINERKGSCRHRAKVFVVLAQFLGIKAELIQNDCHEFVQVWHQGIGWRIHDLGGDDGELNLIKPNKHTEISPNKTAKKNQIIEDDNPYICWQWQKSKAQTFGAYCAELLERGQSLEQGKKNILVSLEREQIEPFLANLQALQYNDEQRYFYIDNLDNIKTTQVVLGANGEKKRQDSELITRIKQAQFGDVLVINWFEMKAEHIVYNTMMDTQQRMLKLLDFPEGLILICLQPTNRSISADFYTRFQLRSKCPTNLPSNLPYPPVVKTLNEEQQKLSCIKMYFPDEYKQLLTVRLAYKGSTIHAIESKLIAALKNGDSGIVIRNAPWNDHGFRTFLGEILYSRRFVANGRSINIPEEFTFVLWDKPYELDTDYIRENTYAADAVPSGIKIINNLTFKSFFSRFFCNNGSFQTMPGWIEQFSGTTLFVVLSHELSKNQRALLGEEAGRYATTIEFINITQAPHQKTESPILQATDLDLAERLYFSANTELSVIPVSAMINYNDLIERYERTGTDNGSYQHHTSCVAQLLLEGKQIVLKGELSELLQRQLSSLFLPIPYLLINGQYHQLKAGQFKVLTTKVVEGNFFTCDTLSLPSSWLILAQQFSEKLITQAKKLVDAYADRLSQKEPFSYIQLKGILERLTRKPYANPFKPLLRLKSNYQELKPIIEELWDIIDPAKQYLSFASRDISQRRIEKVREELSHSSYVFVAGSSGCGKSTLFMQQLERLVPGAKVFIGLDNMGIWQQSTSPYSYLVIEEANLLSKDAFAFLESLFLNPPCVPVDGELKPISSKHKIIFIGNFGYFKDRNQQEFFSRHGHIITFKELPDSLLEYHVLNPILLTKIRKPEQLKELTTQLLQAYKRIAQTVENGISTRNLEMLAWRFLDNWHYAQCNESLSLALYDEFQHLFSDSERPKFLQSLNDYKTIKTERKNAVVLGGDNNFILTPTRRNPLRLINQFLLIREQKLTRKLYFTGVQGIILEGDSAEGKSSLLKHYLDSNDFELATEYNSKHTRRYYVIDELASLEPALYRAFHEGALVIINEMNTMPVELLLNHYMSGVDKEGKCAKKLGFAVLATQNPISFDFRKPLSPALRNRFQMISLPEYKAEEIKMIAYSHCKNGDEAQQETDKYLSARDYAKELGFLKPNIRTLINVCGKKRKVDEDMEEQHKRVRLS